MNNPNVLVSPAHESTSDDEIDLRQLIGTLTEARWWIAGFTAVAAAVGVVMALMTTPIYQVNGLVQVEDSNVGGLSAGLNDLSAMFEGKALATTEIELIRSRMVLGKTVDDLRLDVQVRPKYFPVIGRLLADGPAPVLQVGRFDMPESLLGTAFTLTALGQGQYELAVDGEVLGRGHIGQALMPESTGGAIQLFVRDLQAEAGQVFELVRSDRGSAIAALSASLGLAERGKQSGIINLTYDSPDRVLAVKVLNQVANNYVRQNVERKSAEAQQTLQFLDQQLPDIKKQMEAAEVRFNEFRARAGTVDITKEGELLLQQSVAAETGLLELQQKRKELLSRFTTEHPSVKALDKQIGALMAQQGQFSGRVDNLPKTQQELLRLTRDLQVNQELYTQLTNNAQQLKVVKAGTVGNVRVVDYAELPLRPIKPRKSLIVLVALLLGLLAGVVFAFVRQALRSGVKDSSTVENRLGVSVLATIPVSEAQDQLTRARKKSGGQLAVLAMQDSDDLATESLRSLRTSLHFALIDASNNVLMITGPGPSVGKSFVSVNLAAIMASAGKHVLLIDGDLRRGYLNEYFGEARERGLSELVAGTLTTQEAVRHTPIEGLDYVSTGVLPPNPAELLLHPRFEQFLKEVSTRYDQVLIDSPPVLAVTDGAIIGRHVGATLLVARFAHTELRELELAHKRLQQAGVPINGVLLNRVEIAAGGTYGYQYVYAYKYGRRED